VNNQYKCLTALAMLYMTVKLITVILIYKTILIGPFTATASTLIMPFWFFIGDIIAEVYGYKISRHVIWMTLLLQFLFAFTCFGMLHLHSPPGWLHQDAYEQVLGKLPRVAFASFLAITLGAFINAYILTKWKILLKGKHFWLRSLGASTIGEAIFTLTAYLTEFLGIIPFSTLMQLMAISFLAKLIIGPILVTPASIIAKIIKKIEGVDIYDYSTNFNPFKINLLDIDSATKIKNKFLQEQNQALTR
jgi:uncharacterized integral membrane protein (TIGR00697 family)